MKFINLFFCWIGKTRKSNFISIDQLDRFVSGVCLRRKIPNRLLLKSSKYYEISKLFPLLNKFVSGTHKRDVIQIVSRSLFLIFAVIKFDPLRSNKPWINFNRLADTRRKWSLKNRMKLLFFLFLIKTNIHLSWLFNICTIVSVLFKHIFFYLKKKNAYGRSELL